MIIFVDTSIGRHHDGGIGGQCQAPWVLRWLCRLDTRTGRTQSRATPGCRAALVSHKGAAAGIHSYSRGGVEPPVALLWEPNLKRNSASPVHLHGMVMEIYRYNLILVHKMGPCKVLVSGLMAPKMANQLATGPEGKDAATCQTQ